MRLGPELRGAIGDLLGRVYYLGVYPVRHRERFQRELILKHQQWQSPEDIQHTQWEQVQRLLQYAYEFVPFYRRVFEEYNLRPEQLRTTADLMKLPLLTKRDIQVNLADLRSRASKEKQVFEARTGGSTGHPLTFYADMESRQWSLAEKQRSLSWCGYKPGDRVVYLWGSDYDSQAHRGWKGWLIDAVQNIVWINTFSVTPSQLADITSWLEQFGPAIIVGYTSSIEMFARIVRANRVNLRPKGIQTSAEILTLAQRTLIETTFGCRVFDRYGCREVGNIAHECDQHSGLHLLENNYVEFLVDGRPTRLGEVGKIVVTNLRNLAMPFIRYEIGDLGYTSDRVCPCGRGLPLMGMVAGRTSDVIRSPAGRLIHGEFFTHLFYKIDGVRQFQVLQETVRNLRIRIVPDVNFQRTETISFLRQTILKYGDPRFELTFEFCDRISPSKSGKHRFTLSLLPPE